ncbi:MAG: hypothetical protein NXI32_02390 [bacterium]|nr:hypothetical protein [bacterium]
MTGIKSARVGKGRFQWHAGSWLGAVLGSVGWMVVTSIFLAIHGQWLPAALAALTFLCVSCVAAILWGLRSRVTPLAGLMCLLGLLALAVPSLWFAILTLTNPATLAAMNWPNSWWANAMVVLVVPAIMIRLWTLNEQPVAIREVEAKEQNQIMDTKVSDDLP